MTTVPIRATIDRALVGAAVALATRAPSLHNSQPWSWSFDERSVRLRADRLAVSAVLLMATALGVASCPLSQPAEVEVTRQRTDARSPR